MTVLWHSQEPQALHLPNVRFFETSALGSIQENMSAMLKVMLKMQTSMGLKRAEISSDSESEIEEPHPKCVRLPV